MVDGHAGVRPKARRDIGGITQHMLPTFTDRRPNQPFEINFLPLPFGLVVKSCKTWMIPGAMSAGANSVSQHLVRPKSWGLFSAAGMESGAFYDGLSGATVASARFC